MNKFNSQHWSQINLNRLHNNIIFTQNYKHLQRIIISITGYKAFKINYKLLFYTKIGLPRPTDFCNCCSSL